MITKTSIENYALATSNKTQVVFDDRNFFLEKERIDTVLSFTSKVIEVLDCLKDYPGYPLRTDQQIPFILKNMEIDYLVAKTLKHKIHNPLLEIASFLLRPLSDMYYKKALNIDLKGLPKDQVIEIFLGIYLTGLWHLASDIND